MTDCVGKPIIDIKNACLQKLFIELSDINYMVAHIHGVDNHTADTLCRTSLLDTKFMDTEDRDDVSNFFC